MSNTPDNPIAASVDGNEIPGLEGLQALASERERRVNAWDRFAEKTRDAILSGRQHRQPQEEIDALIECGAAITGTDLFFPDTLAITEVVREQDQFSQGWDITYNCLAASSGDFAPYNPPQGRDYYATREQAQIALIAWLNDKMQAAYEILMGNDASEDIETKCPSCGLPFIVDTDGDIVETFPGDF